MARNPATTWQMLDVAFQNYQAFIARKATAQPYVLTLLDLLHVSNFKGGNASITMPEADVNQRLKAYSTVLERISERFNARQLGDLNTLELETLIGQCDELLRLTLDTRSRIRGFGPSYASALISANFPELVPVLDRRIINGAQVPATLDSQGQVKDIQNHYPTVIRGFHELLAKDRSLSVRELDRRWFEVPLPKAAKRTSSTDDSQSKQ